MRAPLLQSDLGDCRSYYRTRLNSISDATKRIEA